MTELPPTDRLAYIVKSLARHVPGQLSTILEAPRYEDGRRALERLGAPAGAAAAVAVLGDAEAARLADLLLERWAAVSVVVLDPAAILVGPGDVWVSDRPRSVTYEVAVLGVEDGWSAEWPNDSPVLEVPVPLDGQDLVLKHTVRVFCRVAGKREVLVGERSVRARRPVGRLGRGGMRLLVADHLERPAPFTKVAVGDSHCLTDRQGVAHLEEPLTPGAVVLVDGRRTTVVT